MATNPGGTPENLKPWKPGQSGNPGGYSKGRRLTQKLAEMLEDEPFLKAGLIKALDGDFNFWKYIFERMEGKIPDKLEVESTESTKILKVPASKRRRNVADDRGDADP